jgi:hydroxymethylpyrimidine pyrophosphatase-like HAD family hydrolase
MENAEPSLKKAADDIAASNADDGVAAYLESLLDIKEQGA